MGFFTNAVINNENLYNNFLNVHYFGTYDCNSTDVYGPFARDQHMLFVINYGKGALTLGNSTSYLEEDFIFIAPQNQFVKLEPDKYDPCCYSWVAFDGQLASFYINFLKPLTLSAVKVEHCDDIRKLMFKMYDCSESNTHNELTLQSIFLEILAAIYAQYCSPYAYAIRNQGFMNHKQYVDFAVEFINRNYFRSDLCVSEIAEKLHINRSYLTKVFKKQLGVSPSSFIINERMDHAKGLLIDSFLPVSDIANSCGFKDPFYFSPIFSKTYKMSPTEMRNMKKRNP